MPVIPSGVEESLDISETARDVSTSLDMTKRLFSTLDVYREAGAHSAAMNMAIDEALLEGLTVPAIRFYRWQFSALSFGYFGRFADVAMYQGKRDLVRRWTGGGIVFHGEDLTYSILIPANDAAFAESSMWIYEKIHRGLCEALVAKGLNAVVAEVGDPGPWSATTRTVGTALSDAGHRCFANPVRADVVINGRKVAGAAQRRTRCGLLQQGSIQETGLGDSLPEQFAQALSANCCERKVDEEILKLARKLAQQKYGTESWLRKR
jgi:lipoate-protein ligase A